MSTTIDKAFYEAVLKEYEAWLDGTKMYEEKLYICCVSERFKRAYGLVRLNPKIKDHAAKFLLETNRRDSLVGDSDVLFVNSFMPASYKIEVRLKFLQYMVNQYNWQDDETSIKIR